jgi:hypothetical protein
MVRMSEDFAGVFEYAGAKTDKHVREHEVYAVGAAPSGLRRVRPGRPQKKVFGLTGLNPRNWATALEVWAASLEVNSKLLVAAPLAFMLIVGTGVAARAHRNTDGKAKLVLAEAPMQQAITPGSNSSPEKSKQAEAPAKPGQADAPVIPKHAAAPANPEQADAPTRIKPEAPAKAKAEVSLVARAAASGTVIGISALPWAEVYVEGRRQGVSPPLRSVTVLPGKHKVELRNSSFPAHVETIDAKPGESITIRYRFQR